MITPYWRWRLTTNIFKIYAPASTSAGLYQYTRPTFVDAKRFCIPGDLLFSIVNLCRHENVNADDALRHTTRKFVARFREVEKRLSAENREPASATLAEMDEHWDQIKREERTDNG